LLLLLLSSWHVACSALYNASQVMSALTVDGFTGTSIIITIVVAVAVAAVVAAAGGVCLHAAFREIVCLCVRERERLEVCPNAQAAQLRHLILYAKFNLMT